MSTANPASEVRMTLSEHLFELRRRLFLSALAIAVCSVGAYILYDHLQTFLVTYYRNATGIKDDKFISLSPLEGLATRLRLCGYVGLFGASPVWIWQAWRFITPGLSDKEKKYAIPFLGSSVILFIMGAVMGLVTLPAGLDFLYSAAGSQVKQFNSLDKFVSLVSLVVVAFGFSFLFPVVLVFLQLVRAVTSKQLLKGWRYAIVSVFVLAAFITPSQDPWTLLAMALPMITFYFASIGIGRLMKR